MSSSIPQAKLGKYGPQVPALGAGLMNLSGAYGVPPSDEERYKFLDKLLELGDVFWDSAISYGDSEDLLGRWFKRTGAREKIFLASKFGIKLDPKTFTHFGIDSSANYCKQACNESLERLGTDYIDIYYAHRLNPQTPVEETMRALLELKAEGKIKYIGLSEVSSDTLRRACKIGHVDAVQMEYSPFQLDIEKDEGTNLLATCRELGVAVVCYSPIGRGLWTGAFNTKASVSGEGDLRGQRFERFNEENLASNMRILSEFKKFADARGCTTAQLALAWLRKQGEDIIAIPGTKRIAALEENWASLKIELSNEEEKEIRAFLESTEVAGYRSVPEAKPHAYANTEQE